MPTKQAPPISLRLAPADLARVEAVRSAMSRAAGLEEDGVPRHRVIVQALRIGLEALERRTKAVRGTRKR